MSQNENSQVIALSEVKCNKEHPHEDNFISLVRVLAQKNPLLAVIFSIALGLGVPTSFGFLGASQGAASAITEKIQDHEVRITSAERDINLLQAASARHADVLQKIEVHMAVTAEQNLQIKKAIDELKK
jgi:hypothetical protein